jgi:Spy/CpxP family protein refolding chaperone
MKTRNTLALTLMALGASALIAGAQDNGTNCPPAANGPGVAGMGHAGPRGERGFHLLPPRATQVLKLTDDQQQQIAALETETKAKLEKILTAEQLEQLKNMHPPMRERGMGRPPMRGGPGNRQMGPGGDDNNPPAGPPPADGGNGNPPPDDN